MTTASSALDRHLRHAVDQGCWNLPHLVNVEVLRCVEVLEERGHLSGIAVPGRVQMLLSKAAGDLRRGCVHRDRAGMRARRGDAEVIAGHGFVPSLSLPST